MIWRYKAEGKCCVVVEQWVMLDVLMGDAVRKKGGGGELIGLAGGYPEVVAGHASPPSSEGRRGDSEGV